MMELLRILYGSDTNPDTKEFWMELTDKGKLPKGLPMNGEDFQQYIEERTYELGPLLFEDLIDDCYTLRRRQLSALHPATEAFIRLVSEPRIGNAMRYFAFANLQPPLGFKNDWRGLSIIGIYLQCSWPDCGFKIDKSDINHAIEQSFDLRKEWEREKQSQTKEMYTNPGEPDREPDQEEAHVEPQSDNLLEWHPRDDICNHIS